MPETIIAIASSTISGFWYVVCGVYVAPYYKIATSIVLTVIISSFSTLSFMLNFMQGGKISTSLGIIVTLIASVTTCIYMYADRDKIEKCEKKEKSKNVQINRNPSFSIKEDLLKSMLTNKQTYHIGDRFFLTDDSGNPTLAEIISNADENGRYLIHSNNFVKGNKVNSFTEDNINQLRQRGKQESNEVLTEL